MTENADAPRVQTENGRMLVNPERIPRGRYAEYVGYEVREYLLPRMTLETERLVLRHFQSGDAEGCFTFMSSEPGAYMDCCKPFAAMDEAYREMMELFARRPGQLVVTLKDSGEIMGTVNIFEHTSRAVDAMEWGYHISPRYQRRGYAHEALRALGDLLQKELHLELMVAGALEENTASHGLLQKLGFRREGIHHKAAWHEGLDRPVDLVYYYRDRDETNE